MKNDTQGRHITDSIWYHTYCRRDNTALRIKYPLITNNETTSDKLLKAKENQTTYRAYPYSIVSNKKILKIFSDNIGFPNKWISFRTRSHSVNNPEEAMLNFRLRFSY